MMLLLLMLLPPPPPLLMLVQINTHTKTMMLCCSVHFFFLSFFLFSLSFTESPAFEARTFVCYSLCYTKRMFAFALLCCITFFLFCSETFVSSNRRHSKRLTKELANERAHDARISHSIELNEIQLCFFQKHIEELLSTYVNVCIDAKSGKAANGNE